MSGTGLQTEEHSETRQAPPALATAPDARERRYADDPRTAVKARLTIGCGHCGAPIGAHTINGRKVPTGKTGLCRACWLNPEVRPRGRFRRSEPKTQIRNAMHLLHLAADGARGQDPGEGLAQLVDALGAMQQLVREVGTDLVGQVGQQLVADDLGWSKQRVFDRWGGKDGSGKNGRVQA